MFLVCQLSSLNCSQIQEESVFLQDLSLIPLLIVPDTINAPTPMIPLGGAICSPSLNKELRFVARIVRDSNSNLESLLSPVHDTHPFLESSITSLRKGEGEGERDQQPTGSSKQPVRTCYLRHVTGHQPIRDQYYLRNSCDIIRMEGLRCLVL